MEPAKIEWERLESVFVEDQVYENINAPQWVDLLAPLSPSRLPDDVAWFCRPDCKHPKTAEDFINSTPPSSKLFRSASVSKLIRFADWTRGDTNLKKRGGLIQSSTSNEDTENQDPNFSTPNRQIHYLNKAAIKSSAQKSSGDEEEDYVGISLTNDTKKPTLKTTQSAKDLFGGSKELFGKITEFCNELKRLASRTKDDEEKSVEDKHQEEEPAINVLGAHLEKQREPAKERLPLLEVRKDVAKDVERSTAMDKPRRNKIKRADEAENIPISLNLSNIKRKEEEKVLSIRTNPPTPQGFSATRDPVKTTPSKGPKSRLMEREIFEELGQNNTPSSAEKSHAKNASIIGAKEGRTLDVLWFFKPCTLSS
ncbi:uncharacterized protein LOC141596289 isoform X2 [Silene latifolia]|uniref:uncharacterized protein LOC141596289 isoform X2 n=1 Tax=Silene latifolia TaxID=37657 RepID=UPI003D775ED9